METKKIDEYTIEIKKTPEETEPTIVNYELDFILNQIETITKDKEEYVAKRDAELAECNAILAEMTKLDIKEKVIPEVEEVSKI